MFNFGLKYNHNDIFSCKHKYKHNQYHDFKTFHTTIITTNVYYNNECLTFDLSIITVNT